MGSRDYYKTYRSDKVTMSTREILDNETEFNANQFKLYDDFTTDLRISYNPMRNNYITTDRRTADPNDSGVDMENGNPQDDVVISNDADLLENEVMVDPWSSMDSSNSPSTDSGPSASEDCTPSTSSEPPREPIDASSPQSSDARRSHNPKDTKPTIASKYVPPKTDKARSRDLTLDLESLEPDPLRRPHFLDHDDCQSSSKSNIECRIPKPHFLDHSPSPDEFDERSDITNPNFLDDDVDGDDNQAKKAGALPKRPQKPSSSTYSPHEDRPHRTSYRTTLHYGLESAARSSERDKRASQLYRGTWPGERDVWTGHDSASVRSFSSNGSGDGPRAPSNLENKMECVCSLISLLSLSPENNADLSGPLLDMSRSVESCIAMRQAGCIPLLVQLIHSKVPRETRDRAAKALRNIIHTQTDDKAGRREARVWRLLEQVREYCYVLEDLVEARKEDKEVVEDDATKHPSQSVAALMKLSFDEEHRHVVCQLGGLQALAALVSGDQAAHGSRTDDNTCLTMRKYAGMTLTNLTFGDGNNKSLLCSFKDFMLALVEQLESPNDDMRQVTAAVLRNLSWRADSNSKLVLREVGAVKGLTEAAMTCQKEATLKSVLSALWNLTAHCSMNKVALCSVEGALGFLVDMLSYNSPTKTLAIVENAGGIMRNVSSHIAIREDYRQILRERNCLSVLLQHLKSPSLTVVSNSCGTLWNLSARCPHDQQFLWDHGAVPMLRSLIHSKHKMIAMGSGAALKNLLNSKPGKTHIISLDTTARSMNLPALPTLVARKQKALEQELDQNLAETCDNIEPATSPSTSNREEKNLFTATERQIAMNLERHRMTSSSPLMGNLTSQISLSHSAHLASYLSCSNTLLKGALVSRSSPGSAGDVHRSDSKDSVTSTHSDSVFDRVTRTGKLPVPTPRNKDLMKAETGSEASDNSKLSSRDNALLRYPMQPPVPPPRSTTDLRPGYAESGFDVDQDSCDRPIDFSQKYSETKTTAVDTEKSKEETEEYAKKENPATYGDYQETDLDQPTDYSLRYAEHQSETGSDSEPVGPSVHEDTIQHFATEGTPYETPIIFSTATSMSDLRVIGKEGRAKTVSSVKENPEVMTHSDEKDTCSIEDPPRHDNDLAATTPQSTSATEPAADKRGVFDTKFSSGMISPEKPVNYCDEGTPGYFSRVSSLSSLGEPTEEDCLAKKNAMATINVDPSPPEQNTSITKDKEGSKAVTFASTSPESEPRYVEETPLMFSRSSSLGSLPDCPDHQDEHASVVSEISRMTSGCLSPSELPESPGASSPRISRTVPDTPPQEARCMEQSSVFSERVSQFAVEHTPAIFSAATSLSSLTIEHNINKESLPKLPRVRQDDIITMEPNDDAHNILTRDIRPVGVSTPMRREPFKECTTPGELCRIYCTEDTPGLSKATSRSDLSVLSIDSSPPVPRPILDPALDPTLDPPVAPLLQDSDSSNTSDAGDLLEECIQKGIAKVVKNKAALSEVSAVNPFRDDVYRSLPPYLVSSTETVKLPERGRSPSASPAPPLPPKQQHVAAPPPPRHLHIGAERESGAPSRRRLPGAGEEATRSPSLSSLSVESFGSTDREIFEATVSAGARHPRPPRARARPRPRPRSLDAELSDESFGSTDREVFERCVRAGMQRRRRAPPADTLLPPPTHDDKTKNGREPSAGRAPAGGHARAAPPAPPPPGCEPSPPSPPAARSNECLAPRPLDDTLESEREELDASNESYADGSWSDAADAEPRPHYTDMKLAPPAAERSRPDDTWNDNTCPDDVTFPTISGSVHAVSSLRSDVAEPPPALPDLLETSDAAPAARPDLTDRLERTAPSAPSPPPDDCRLDSLMSAAIEREAARLAALLAAAQYSEAPEPGATSPAARKRSLPAVVRRALADSMERGEPASFLDDVKPPSEMDRVDMEGSIVSVASIVSEVADGTPLAFELGRATCEFPARPLAHLCDLSAVDPPSLFHEMAESLLELDRSATTVPPPADVAPSSSEPGEAESAPPRRREPGYLTPKERRHLSKDRYQTYTITDTVAETDVVQEAEEEFLTWTKSESERSEESAALATEPRLRRRVSARQRRLDDRARYRTQTVDVAAMAALELVAPPGPGAPRTNLKQRRLEEAERYRTRTLSEDVPPEPTFTLRDAALENVESTTGYDSLSSNEPNHQLISEETAARDADSGHNDDYADLEFAPDADLCLYNNLKNIELTASYRVARPAAAALILAQSGDGVGYEGDTNSEDRARSDSDAESPRPKPKIIKPTRRDESLSNESPDEEREAPKAIRGRKKALYVSPYRRTAPPAPVAKPAPKSATPPSRPTTSLRAQSSAKPATETPKSSWPASATTSPKKSAPNRSPTKTVQRRAITVPAVAAKPLPLERQGTFTKEESTVPPEDLPVPDKKPAQQRLTKSAPQTKANTSPSRLPQWNRYSRPSAAKPAPNRSPTKLARKPETTMKNSASNHSLQSNESGRTVTLASRSSRQGSTSSVNSVQSTSKAAARDVESKIASLWKKVEHAKTRPTKPDKRVWIESDKTEPPRLIRSSTFEGQPKLAQASPAAKQKSAIGIRISQIPSLRPKTTNAKTSPAAKKPTTGRVFARKVNGQIT